MTTPPPIPNAPLRNRWYYADANNQPVGPVTSESLHSFFQNGTISFDTLVLQEDGTDWLPYRSVSGGAKPLVPVPPNTITRAGATRKCPFCAEQIFTEAKKCKHCGETLDVTLRAAEEAKRTQSNPMVFMNAGSNAVSSEKHNFPHGMHLILTILTAGAWAVIWVLHYLFRNRSYYR